MKNFFKKFFKILLVLVLMFVSFGAGVLLDIDTKKKDADRDMYWKGYNDAKELYYVTVEPKSKSETTATPTPKQTKEPTSATEPDKNISTKVGSKTYTIRQSVKEELDAYEEYWGKYVETIKSAKSSDPIGYLTKYTEMVQKLEEIDQHPSKRNDLTKEEDAYYGARLLEIYQKMVQAMMAF